MLFRIAAVVLGLLVPALALGDPLLASRSGCPRRSRPSCSSVAFGGPAAERASPALLPVPLVLFVCGLFLAVTALGRLGLTELLAAARARAAARSTSSGSPGWARSTANLADNLPAYLALEPVAGTEHRLLALLVAVNAGPLITPWASLATLLWHARPHRAGRADLVVALRGPRPDRRPADGGPRHPGARPPLTTAARPGSRASAAEPAGSTDGGATRTPAGGGGTSRTGARAGGRGRTARAPRRGGRSAARPPGGPRRRGAHRQGDRGQAGRR